MQSCLRDDANWIHVLAFIKTHISGREAARDFKIKQEEIAGILGETEVHSHSIGAEESTVEDVSMEYTELKIEDSTILQVSEDTIMTQELDWML